MKMAAPARRRDELVLTHKAPTNVHTTPTLRLASIIGNTAMRSLLATPTVQRSFWDDVTEAAAGASDWFGGGATTQEQPPAVDAPMSDSNVTDDALDPSNEPEFQDVMSPAEVRDEAGANEADDEGSWFENWFGEQQQEQQQAGEVTSASYIEPEATQPDECAQLEAEIARLSEYIQRLHDESQAMLPDVEALKAEAEALERSAPGSPQAAEARQRFEELHQRYNAIVDECLNLMEMRNSLRQQLEDCRARRKSGPQPTPEYM
jgi:hypothetical protein